MRKVRLQTHIVEDWSSSGVQMIELLRLNGSRTHIAYFATDSVLGRHAGSRWQLFCVLSGEGWVVGQDGIEQRCVAGDSFVWSPGESHESGSRLGMVAVIVQSKDKLPAEDAAL